MATEKNEVPCAISLSLDHKTSARLFMYTRNKSGPNTEPRGTPALTSAQEEAYLLSTTLCFLFFFKKKLYNKFKRLSDIYFKEEKLQKMSFLYNFPYINLE